MAHGQLFIPSRHDFAQRIMNEKDPGLLSRWQMVGGATHMAAAAAGPSLAQAATNSTSSNEATMNDPRSKYPKPPFRKQTQPWPGLARDMDPKPDHGEASYRGSGRLA